MIPAWLPDCRDKHAYPALSSTLVRWAWEFLRRNADYQKAWAEMIAPYYSADLGYDPDLPRAAGIPDPLSAMRDKFGVAFLPPDPADSRTVPVFEHNLIYENHPGAVSGSLARDQVAVVFNLAWPLEPQIARAERSIRERRERLVARGEITATAPRNHKALWQDYLRLLDGEAAGLQTARLAAIIYPKTENLDPDYAGSRAVTNGLKAARKLRDGDWRQIPMHPDK